MKRFENCLEESGYNAHRNNEPESVYVWYAYKEGKVTECPSEKEAKAISKNYERVNKSAELLKKYKEETRELYQKAIDTWYTSLREDYDISDAMFDLCYNMAYDRHRRGGYDEVANGMDEIVDFAEKIYLLGKNNA